MGTGGHMKGQGGAEANHSSPMRVLGLGALIPCVLAQVRGAGVLLCARGALNVPNRAFRCNMISPRLQVRLPDRTGCLILSLVLLGRVTG